MLINDICRNEQDAPERIDRQLIGIELEVEGVHRGIPRGTHALAMVQDGSLRDGLEFISRPVSPLSAVHSHRSLMSMPEAMDFRATPRTSTHVHVDVRRLTTAQLLNVLGVYCALEPLLMELCGPEREQCIYAIPWYKSHDIAKMARADLLDGPTHMLSNYNKYSALNLQTVLRLGTLEFRQAPAFLETADLARWIMTVLKVVRRGVHYTPDDTMARCLAGYNSFAYRILGRRTLASIPDPETVCDRVDGLGALENLLSPVEYPRDWQQFIQGGTVCAE